MVVNISTHKIILKIGLKIMYTEELQELGLAKNEARIYETLLREGELSVGKISTKSKVHRRNVYDSLNRLVEKGIVFEILQKHENHYQAVEPQKLSELLQEKQANLLKIMPNLEKLYKSTPHKNEVYIYRGVEGWKNYMREILRIGKDNYTIGGKGAWADEKIRSFLNQFVKQAKSKGINFHILFDHEVKSSNHEITKLLGFNSRFLPKDFSTPSSIDIFGDHVAIIAENKLGQFDENITFTVIVNQQIADSFRTWFKLLWSVSKEK